MLPCRRSSVSLEDLEVDVVCFEDLGECETTETSADDEDFVVFSRGRHGFGFGYYFVSVMAEA